MPPLETALAGMTWFMRCGEEKEMESGGKRLMWFDFDAARAVFIIQTNVWNRIA